MRKYNNCNIRLLYFGNLVLAFGCCCGSSLKQELLSKHVFQRKQQLGGWKKPQSNDKFIKTVSFHHMEKKSFCSGFFEGLWVRHFFPDSKKTKYALVCTILPYVSRVERPNKCCLSEVNLVLYMQILICQSVNLLWKIAL